MLTLTSVLLLLSISASSFGAICPPAMELTPCLCNEITLEISCKNIPGRFDIKAIFDRATPFMDTTIIYNDLIIFDTSLFEIPANAIPALKFKTITIDFNKGLDYISPDAFNATYAVTVDLSLWNNVIINDAPNEAAIFDFFNKFQKVSKIWIPNSRISSIPSNAFANNPSLTQLYLGSNSIASIGAFAFSGLPNLESLWMSHNSLTESRISPDAFSGISQIAKVDLTYNTAIEVLDETIFKPLLDNALSVEVGGRYCNSNGCTYRYLYCDSRADWICPKVEEYRNKLVGFLCVGGNPKDIWAYCQNLGVSGK